MKNVLITGGSGSIGKGLVEAFCKDYNVLFTYNKNVDSALEIEKLYGANALKCDLRNSTDVLKLADTNIDILINNAGISQIKLFTDITDDDWNNMLDINLTGAFYVTKAVLPYMIHQKMGKIINISSMWGRVGASCEVHYSAAKAGLIGFTKALAKEVAPSNITVNCIAPGVIEGNMNSHLKDEELQALIDETPLCKIGTPQDVAHAALFFAQADFVTGQVIGVDGGFCI